ncbi:MAG TPA: TIR domain-containing protein, partial [Anaerolineales bacterium]|nr:TIR domain-containing protein [Anaerolineales bacterium]
MTQKLIGHVFMSYSRRDEAVMRRVVDFLRSRGIDVWVDNEKLIPGTPVWEAEIEKAIFGASATVVILSPDSKASEWVRREISYTERYQKRIFPVLVSGDENSSVSIRLTNHQYVDIRNDEAMGLERLSAALLFYLEDLETRKRRALEDAEEQTQAQAKREKEKREATRLRLERERAEQERVEREKVGQKWAEKEKLAGQKVVEEEPANQQIESRVAPVASAPPQVKKASERKLVSKESGQSSLNFRWFPVLLMALGWAVVVSLGVSLLSMLLNMGVSQPNS